MAATSFDQLKPSSVNFEDRSGGGGLCSAGQEADETILTVLGRTLHLQSAFIDLCVLNAIGPACVEADAATKNTADELVIVQRDCLVLKGSIFIKHLSSPVVGQTSTVAEAGGVASAPGGGPQP